MRNRTALMLAGMFIFIAILLPTSGRTQVFNHTHSGMTQNQISDHHYQDMLNMEAEAYEDAYDDAIYDMNRRIRSDNYIIQRNNRGKPANQQIAPRPLLRY